MTDMTDKSKHTPVAWVSIPHETENKALVQSGDGRFLAEMWSLDKTINCSANAARLVACVNAMADIDDPQKLRETWEAIKHLELDAYHKMKEERDALLEYATDIYKVVTQTPSTSKQQTALLNKVLELAINMKGVTHAS